MHSEPMVQLMQVTLLVNGVCQVTPDVAMFPLLKVGLCAEVPTYENYLTKL